MTNRPGVRALSVSTLPYICVYELRAEAVIVLHIFHATQSRPKDLQ